MWSECVKGRDRLEDLGADARVLKWTFGKQGKKLLTGFVWFRIRTSGGLL
jgi:hypothetical protein